jgi:hypothetical protein
MKLLKFAPTVALLHAAAATYTAAQVRQTTSNVNKAKTSSSEEKDTTAPQYHELRCRGGGAVVGSQNGLPGVLQLQFLIMEGTTNQITNERMMNMMVWFRPGTEGGQSNRYESRDCPVLLARPRRPPRRAHGNPTANPFGATPIPIPTFLRGMKKQ